MRFSNLSKWLALTLLVMVSAWLSLHRLLEGRLFLLPLPFDVSPTEFEIQDARKMAALWIWPTLAFLGISGGIGMAASPYSPWGQLKKSCLDSKTFVSRNMKLSLLYFSAVLMDLASTLYFFHEHGMLAEAHPGIQPISYAYGRTAGAITAKCAQTCLACLLAGFYPRLGKAVFILGSLFCLLASAYNLQGWN